MQVFHYRLPPIRPLVVAEIAVIVLFALVATKEFSQDDPSLVQAGTQAQWLTSSGFMAAQTFRNEGYVPFWEPWIAHGQPLIDDPFSFILNPISAGPGFLFGGATGVRISIVLYAIFAGLGGWALGRVMGFGALARLILGLLCVGKGNMHTTISAGFFQLGVTQAYLPWIAAGTIAVVRLKNNRWPVVLLAIMFTLMFWAGNIYFTLPAVVMIVLLTLSHLFYFAKHPPEAAHENSTSNIVIDRLALRRIVCAGVLTIGLIAITFLPIIANQRYLVGPPDDSLSKNAVELAPVIQQFFSSDELFRVGTWHETYYSYVVPLWFAVLIFVLFPPIYPWVHQPANPRQDWRVWAVGIVIIIFFTLWGAGLNPVVEWLYQNVPLIGQWQPPSNMLAVSSFWLAILVSMRIDGLWRVIARPRGSLKKARGFDFLFSERMVSILLMFMLIFSSVLASWQVISTWTNFPGTDHEDVATDRCVTWLRQQNPIRDLSVYTTSYPSIYTFLRNQVRHAHINADYQPQGITSTIFSHSLLDTLPEYFIPYSADERHYAESLGYQPVKDSPLMDSNAPCLDRKTDVLSYAFSAPRSTFNIISDQLATSATTPITSLERHADRIALAVAGNETEPLVVVVQELAWPGWQVTVDGASAKLESVGQLIGVVLPPGTAPHFVIFQYMPPLFVPGGILTLFTIVVCILYLLHVDRLIPPQWKGYYYQFSPRVWAGFKKLFLDPSILTPDDY